MNRNDTIEQNALEINAFVAKLALFLAIMAPVILVSKLMNVLNMSWLYTIAMTVLYVISCLIPVICKVGATNGTKLRYCALVCSAVSVMILYWTFGRAVLAMWFLPLLMSVLFVDTKLLKFSLGLTVPSFVVMEAIGLLTASKAALDNMLLTYVLIVLQLVIYTIVIIKAIKSVDGMMNNIQSLYDNINGLISNAAVTSEGLRITENSFLVEIGSSNLDKGEIIRDPEDGLVMSPNMVNKLNGRINGSVTSAKDLLKYNKVIDQVSGGNEQLVLRTEKEIKELEQYAEKSKAAIAELVKNVDKVNESITLMSTIVDESSLIAMAASLEAARAAERKEPADKILELKTLADKSADSAFNVKMILKDIVADADYTVKSVNDTYSSVAHSLDMINRTVETLIKGLMLKKMH